MPRSSTLKWRRCSIPEGPARTREYLGRAALLVVSLLAALFALELAGRVWRGTLLDWSNFVVGDRQAEKVVNSLMVDRELGFISQPHFGKAPCSHDAQGFRTVPSPPSAAAGQAPVLAVGDSLTYGSEVSDTETWPAYLQQMVGRRVVNAGVPGYGLDQAVLYAERLAPTLKPGLIILGFIADDVRRGEFSRLWSHEKPYFIPKDGSLELRNVPVPADPPLGALLPWWERLIGWSVLADILRGRLLDDQHEYFGDHERALPRGAGERLVCPLMKRLAGIGAPTLVVAQYDPKGFEHEAYGVEARRLSRLVLGCAEQAGLATLDTFTPVEQAVRAGGLAVLYGPRSGHHNPAGNRLIAELIAAELARRQLLR